MHWAVKSQYTVKHYVLKTYPDSLNICISCNTKWLLVTIYLCLSFKTVNATCIILPHLPTSAFVSDTVSVMMFPTVTSGVIGKNISRCLFKLFSFQAMFFIYLFFYCSRNIWDRIRYSMSITKKINKRVCQTHPCPY